MAGRQNSVPSLVASEWGPDGGREAARCQGIRAEGLCRLLSAAHPRAWSREAVDRELRREDARVWWMGTDLLPVGALLARAVLDELHIFELAVESAFRRRGIGRALIQAAVRQLPGSIFLLELRSSNLAARNLYEECGFVVEGRRPRYYPDGEDALLMTL